MKHSLNLFAFIVAAITKNPRLLTLPKEQMEREAYDMLKTPAFAPFFIEAAKFLAKLDKDQAKRFLGQIVDYSTRRVAHQLTNHLKREVHEPVVTEFRYAVMNVLRDEASRYAKGTKGDRFISENGKSVLVRGDHCDFHVAKNHKDEPQYLVDEAMSFLDRVLGTAEDVTQDSRLTEKEQSVYDNDRLALISEGTERSLTRFFQKFGRKNFVRGETPAAAAASLRSAIDTLLDSSQWTGLKAQNHITRLNLAQTVQRQLDAATTDRVAARQYHVKGDTIRVGIYGRTETPIGIPYVVMHGDDQMGWDVLDTGLHFGDEANARAEILALHEWQTEGLQPSPAATLNVIFG